MKAIKILSIFIFSIGLLFGASSCAVFVKHDSKRSSVTRHDNGKHKGWFKNSKNPHHPKSTNPGKKKGHHKK